MDSRPTVGKPWSNWRKLVSLHQKGGKVAGAFALLPRGTREKRISSELSYLGFGHASARSLQSAVCDRFPSHAAGKRKAKFARPSAFRASVSGPSRAHSREGALEYGCPFGCLALVGQKPSCAVCLGELTWNHQHLTRGREVKNIQASAQRRNVASPPKEAVARQSRMHPIAGFGWLVSSRCLKLLIKFMATLQQTPTDS